MKVININDVKSPALCYVKVPQPMYIYHTWEEFLTNTPAPRIIISGIADYLNFITAHQIDLTYNSNNKYIDVIDKNVWIKTIDRFIPETANFAGEITYKLTSNGNKIITDACYIQLYFITPTPTRNVLFTSSGVHTVGMTKWSPTAAQRYNYSQESDPRRGMDRSTIYADRMMKVMRRRGETIQMTKVVAAMLNPASLHFLDFNGTVKQVFPWIKADDRKKLLETESFRKALMSVLKTFFPDLAPAIRKVHSPDEMAAKLQSAFKIAEEKKDVKAMLEVFGAILTTGYEESTIVNDQTGQVLPTYKPKELSESDEHINGEPDMTMTSLPDVELTEEEVQESYPSSFIAMSKEELEKATGGD